MKKIYFLTLLSFIACGSFGQSILDPNDTIVTYNPINPPTQPAPGQIGKWVRTKRLNWNTSEYKSYIYKGNPFRLHFPKTYNPTANDGKKYPLLIFFHGLGETDTSIYDNEYQLYHGGQNFQDAVNNGTYDGYVLFMQTSSFWTNTQFQAIADIIDYMVANNKLDPFATSVNGISAGGQGTWDMLFSHPTYVAADIPMSSVSILFTNQDTVNKVKFTPVWNVQGGQDQSPAPYTAEQVRNAMVAGGANYTYTEYPTQGHDTWDSTWLLPQFFTYIDSAYSSNPWTLFGRTKFCPGDNINVTIGLTPGFQAYQWRFNNNLISGATKNSIQVTQAGKYDARVERNGIWSDWSRIPVQIIIQSPSPTPPIQVAGLMSTVIPAADGKNYVNLQVSGNDVYTNYTWKKVGSDSVYSTQPVFKATQPGYYTVAALPQYGCSALASVTFKVIDANGGNTPNAVKSLVANAISNTQVQLSWSLSAQQANAPTALEIYRGTVSGNYSFIAQVAPSVKSYTDSLLTPKVKYFYVIRAIDSTGAAPLSNEASTSTYSDTTAPSIPTNLKVAYTTTSAISIAWTASTDNVSVDHYNIYVDGTLSNITKQTTFTLTGLTQSQPYAICVKAVDASNNVSSKSNQVTAEPILGGLQYSYYPAAVPFKLLPDFRTLTPAATGVTKNLTLNIAQQPYNFAVLWQGYINVPVSGSYIFQLTSDDGSALYFNSYTPNNSKRLISNDGPHGAKAVRATTNITAGIYPVCIEYFQNDNRKSINLSWASTALFGDTVQRTIADNYFNGTYNNAGTAPLAPTKFTATAIAFDKINLSWQDNSSNETGFEIYRSQTANGVFNIIGTAAANANSFIDSLLSPSTTYYYKIQAINKYGNSGLSQLDTANANGVSFNYYVGSYTTMPNFTPLTPSGKGVSSNFSLAGIPGNGYGVLFQGKINIPTTGSYTFYTTSDNGSYLYIDGYSANNAVVKNVFSSVPHEQSGTINLTQGSHTIFLAYYYNAAGNSGGASLNVSYQGPSISKQIIPSGVLTYQTVLSSAITFLLPAAPSAPANFTATATSASQISLTWSSVSGATGYQLLRSIGDTSNYNLLTSLPSNASSYNDTALNANIKHYYKLQATGSGGTLSAASLASAITKDNAPVITKLKTTFVPYGTITTIPLTATDADDDILTYTGSNLPAFVSISSGSNNNASLIINPSSTNLGSYTNIKVVVKDAFGGKDSTIFTLTVNSNYLPSIDTIPNYTLNENDSLRLNLNATDQNSGDVLKWSATNLPNGSVLTDLGNRKAQLFLHPNYLAAGTYNPVITVNDGKGGITTRTFTLVVNDVNPNTNLYVRFKNIDTIGAPWNNITGVTTNNLVDFSGKTTGIGLALQTSWFGTSNAGPSTGNNSGVYPDAVLKDYYYFGNNGGPSSVDTKITGLTPNKSYNLTFFGASNYNGYSDNGSTVYTIGSVSDTLAVQNNISKTVTISNVLPDASGTITFTISKGVNSPNGYINALIVSSIYNDGTVPLAATSLSAQNIAGRGVKLTWNDVAYNEQGYRVYRALSYNGVYSLVGTTQSEATTYIDTSVNGNIPYSYKIRAYNVNGSSAYSNIVTITTLDKLPTIAAINDVLLKNNQTASVNITAKDDAADHIKLSVSNLPSFATFTDNGNGTGKIAITPSSNDQGNFVVTITATDNSDSSVSTAFNILVSDPKVSSTYLSFSDGAHSVPKPWNLIAPYPYIGASYNNLTDDNNSPTGITLTLKNGFQGVAETGMQPVDGVGIYPNSVMRPGFFEGNAVNDTIQLSGLSSSKAYNFVFFNSHDDGLNCTTNFTVNGKTVSLNASGNLYRTIQINGMVPDATGIINIIVSKDVAANYAFITTLIIQSYDSAYKNISPTNLDITKITRNSIGLIWQDRASTETGYQVWRAANGDNSYTLISTVAAGVKTYTDANVSSDKTYRYIVRGVFGKTYSNFSNVITATTYSYNVFLNFTFTSDALLPWNNLDAPPQIGYSWNNFFDEKGFITGIGMQLNTEWAGIIAGGVQPTPHNSGIYPDAVMADSYGLFPGQLATFQVTGLNLKMKYDFTFFASSSTYADINVAYTINGVTTLLDASLNVNGTQTIYGVTPDNNGNVTITVAPGTSTSLFGLIGAMIIGGYTPSDSTVTPTLPQSQQGAAQNAIASAQNQQGVIISNKEVQAFPNPFHNYFTLSVPAEKTNDKIQVVMYDVTGKLVYSNQFTNVNAGMNSLNITPGNNLTNGIYTVVVINGDAKRSKTIKIMRQ